ncbi:MAG: hypothetical protein AB7S75_14965 [Desulfococcaceae bacterium]
MKKNHDACCPCITWNRLIVQAVCFAAALTLFLIPGNVHAVSLDTPEIKIKSYCLHATVSWEKIENAIGYELWYMPYGEHDAWNYIDLDADTEELSAELWDGAHFHIALIAYNKEGWSDYSQTEILQTGNFALPPNPNVVVNGLNVKLTWNNPDEADGYRLWFSLDAGENWDTADFDKNTRMIAGDLWEGAYVTIAMQSLKNNGSTSYFSNVITFFTGKKPDITTTRFASAPFCSNVVNVFPANPSGRYSNVLQDCVYSNERKESCGLSVLPLIGQESFSPGVDSIIDRTVVSHRWMAERFRKFLTMLPAESLHLFRAVTAIVISSDIRPSYYDADTGAMYIDPDYLWITQEEKDTIDQSPDYRSGCGDCLKYRQLSRYIKNDQYLYNYYTRTDTDILHRAAHLLFHELSHANDYFPPASLVLIPKSISVKEASDINFQNRLSYRLHQDYPLLSDILKYQAQVDYGCRNATCRQTNYTPDDITAEFMNDFANDTYNYYDVREDFAMLSEEALMLYFFGAERDVAVTDVPAVENPVSKDYIVQWGQRRRIADPMIKDKVRFILSGLLPGIDFSAYFDTLEPPENMTKGLSWADNLVMGNSGRERRNVTREEQYRKPEEYINYE